MGRYGAYPVYKASGVAWLGEIPVHWDVWKVTHGFDRIGSGTTPKSDDTSYYDGDIPWVTTSELRETIIDDTTQKVTEEALKEYSALKKYSPGSLLIAMYGATIGRLGILGIAASVNQACCVFSDPSVFDTKFFYYWLWMRRPILVSLSTGGGQPNLSQDDLKQLRVPLPPLPEQQAIARFLDHKTAQIDALIARKEALLARLADKRTALISQAVTKGLDPAAPTKASGIDWLGEIPAHWETRQLKHLVRSDTSITYGIVQAGPHVEDGVPYIRTGDMAGEYLPIEGYLRTSHEIDRQYHRSKVSTGDVVVAIRATVGKCLPVPPYLDGANLTQGTAKVSPGNDLDRSYLLWVMRSGNIQQRFDAVSKGSTFREITLDMLRRLVIPVPPLVEQQAIAEVAQKAAEQTYSLASKVNKAIDKLKQYRTALITHAVTGKIDVRGVALPD